jgi:hypothetical protein
MKPTLVVRYWRPLSQPVSGIVVFSWRVLGAVAL